MPSLHFGYSLLIGLTIATLPLTPTDRRIPGSPSSPSMSPRSARPATSRKRLICLAIGIFYPTLILVAIIATANHFFLDAVAGATVCAIAWSCNDVMLNLCVVEDWFLWLVRIHKPSMEDVDEEHDKGEWVH